MKRLAFFLLFFICLVLAKLQASDTLHVITHKNMTIVTDIHKGIKSYKSWGVFPPAKEKVRKILLCLSFGCPDSMRCADWDYLDFIKISRVGGNQGKTLNFEIARMLTPYGGAFGKNWNFTWETDITDFGSLLRDSVEIEYIHSGYEPCDDRGWKLNLDFTIIMGPPVADIISLEKVYEGSFHYGDSTQNIEDSLKPFPFITGNEVYAGRFRIAQTGHGMNEKDGCGEFCDRFREILLDGRVIDKKQMWKKCGSNPLFPQAGTWLFDRANWCPGELNIPDVYDFRLPPGSSHLLDVNMEKYSTPNSTANESFNAFLFLYSSPKLKFDISVEDITVPNGKQLYGRQNPSCMQAVVRVRNIGSVEVNELLVEYSTDGFKPGKFLWKGRLSFNQSAEITLPGEINAKNGYNQFVVKVLKVNGKSDQYVQDNIMTSSFNHVPVHSPGLIIQILTNEEASQTSCSLVNSAGETIFERKQGSLKATTAYKDTFSLKPGCYRLMLADSAGDGLEFWYNVKAGRGYFRLLDTSGTLLKNFESDFGSYIIYNFEVQTGFKEEISAKPAIGLFPTLTTAKTKLDYFSNKPCVVRIVVTGDNGKDIVEEHIYQEMKEAIIAFDFSYRKPQRYYLKVYIGEELLFNKRIRVVEKMPF